MIQVVCSHCGLRILVPPTVQGKQGICFNCGQPMRVPDSATLSSRSIDFQPNERVADRYIIESPIGKGGMGIVYKALDTLVQEVVALKFMKPEMLRTQRGQNLFIQEAQVARRLRHENIVAVHDVSWTKEGILYLSMEYAEGSPLRSMLSKHRAERRLIDVRLTVSIIRQTLEALEYAHQMVVHRDIKPENIMLLSRERVKVLDFGLAKAVHEEILKTEEERRLSEEQRKKAKHIVGTLAYAAPEQKRKEAVDMRADLYAVGLVMHELLTLRTPVDPPVTVAQVRKDVAPSLLAVLERSLEPDKSRRWTSAGDFLRALNDSFEQSYSRPVPKIHINRRTEKPVSTDNMIYLEGGSFLMGNNAIKEEAPEEELFVKPFYMDKYLVTVGDYGKFLAETGSPEPRFWHDPQCNGEDQPVVGVSWHEAMAYAEWAGKQLPTEEQWEFAARGRENRKYPWGNLPPDTTRCNYADYLGMPAIVTMHDEGQTPEGIFDLAGNVFEWTRDPFARYTTIRNDPENAAKVPRRAVRGGCYSSLTNELLCTSRQGFFPEAHEKFIGFRCVLPA